MEKIKLGVFGVGRGMDIVKNFMLLGCEVVAICDNHKERREKAAAALDSSVAVRSFRALHFPVPFFPNTVLQASLPGGEMLH